MQSTFNLYYRLFWFSVLTSVCLLVFQSRLLHSCRLRLQLLIVLDNHHALFYCSKNSQARGRIFFLSRSSSLLSMQWLCSMHSDWSTAISSAYTMSFTGVTSVLLLARVMQFQRSFLDRLLNIIIWKWHSVHIYTWLWRITSTLHDQTLLSLIRRTNNYNVWISIDCLLYASK